jgi:precorrin-4/cobalt-precorrin-4 C11-methyltransferase
MVNNLKNSSDRPAPTGQVWFIGAGPGAEDLITLRGHRLIAEADLVLYAGSLVPVETVSHAKSNAVLRDSSSMTLDETHALIKKFALRGQNTARVHTGDPSLYGALLEQTRLLDRDSIAWSVVPGVTAAFAAAAVAGQSLTLPIARQTLVLTRLPGKTVVPHAESLRALAVTGAALAIYLSAEQARELQTELLAVGLDPATKIIVGHRVTWPDETVETARLDKLADFMRHRNFSRQVVFLVLPGETLDPNAEPAASSRLYAPGFTHAFRKSKPAL